MTETTFWLDLEQQLIDDRDGSTRTALLAHLQGLQERLASRRRQLNPRHVDVQLAAAMAALEGASAAVKHMTVPDRGRLAALISPTPLRS